MGAHFLGTEGAVQANRQRVGMADGMPERGRCLARQCAARQVGDRAGNHDRQVNAFAFKRFKHGNNRGLGIQRIKDRLDQNDLRAAVDQPTRLLVVGNTHLVKRHGTKTGVVDVWRDRQRAVGGPDSTGHKPAAAVALFSLDRSFARQPSAVHIQLIGKLFHEVIGLGDGRGGKRIGFHNVRARKKVIQMDVTDRIGLGQDQQVVVALEIMLPVLEALGAKISLGKLPVLNFSTHGAVKHQNTLGRSLLQSSENISTVGFPYRHLFCSSLLLCGNEIGMCRSDRVKQPIKRRPLSARFRP